MFNKLFKQAPEKVEREPIYQEKVLVMETEAEDTSENFPVSGYPKIIHDIHSEFESASDFLLQQAEMQLKESVMNNRNKAERLAALGFDGCKEVGELRLIQSNEAKAKYINETIAKYRQAYPLHKFITREVIDTICEKYSLVFAKSHLYKGFVPEKNISEIESFLGFAKPQYWIHTSNYLGMTKKGNSKYEYSVIILNEDEALHQEIWNEATPEFHHRIEVNNSHPPMFICAPAKDLDTQGMEIENGKLVYEVTDPIILYPVSEGYLIVTKWGDEASDPLLTNPIEN
jgi:hypothetical protein